MRHIDRLYMKALKIKPQYDDIVIVTNETGQWMIKDDIFESLEAAQAALDDYIKGDDVIVIINDAPPDGEFFQPERLEDEREENQVEHQDTDRDKKDIDKSNEHGCKRNDGQQKSQYNHSWV